MTRRRIIINNDTKLSDYEAMRRVLEVVEGGRVSGMDRDTYCYLSVWADGVKVATRRNSDVSDTFYLVQDRSA